MLPALNGFYMNEEENGIWVIINAGCIFLLK